MKISTISLALVAALSTATHAETSELSEIAKIEKQLKELKAKLKQNEEKLEANQQKLEKQEQQQASEIKVSGAVRFQYGIKDYDKDDKDRNGDFDFDVFRLDFNGTSGDIIFSAQYRWYQYMDTIHHAYLGYQFDDNWQGQVGITQVPFGNLTWNSNSFFFSTNFYVGLEDDYDAGLKFIGDFDKHNIQLAYFKTDELGGIDGFVSDRTGRYSYDIVGTRQAGQGIYDTPASPLAEDGTLNIRYAYKFDNTEVGVSLLTGDIEGSTGTVGDRSAYAFHLKSQIDALTVMFQYTDYEMDLDDNSELVTVGAYSFHDTIPTAATIYNLNLAYSVDVDWGPISNLKFYNDYNLMTDKSGGLTEDTMMNVLGVQVTSGNLYTLIDFASGRNQPFLGGSLADNSKDTNSRLNINFGFYF